jgi:hypothetical protein
MAVGIWTIAPVEHVHARLSPGTHAEPDTGSAAHPASATSITSSTNAIDRSMSPSIQLDPEPDRTCTTRAD